MTNKIEDIELKEEITVKKLIEVLQKMPQDARVGCCCGTEAFGVKKVSFEPKCVYAKDTVWLNED